MIKSNFFKCLYLLILLSSFFSVASLSINPVYILGLLVIGVSLLSLNLSRVDKFQFLNFIFLLSFVMIFWRGYSVISTKVAEFEYEFTFLSSMLFCYCFLLGLSIIHIGNSLLVMDRKVIYLKVSNYLIIFLIMDLLSRVIMSQGVYGNFYDFKWGFFYFDSNFTGLVVLSYIIFYTLLKRNNIVDIGMAKLVFLFVLLIFTFSRAAIFACVVFFVIYFLPKRFRFFILFLFSFISIYVFVKMVGLYLNGESFVTIDGSFNSKFYVIKLALDNYINLEIENKILGIGLANFGYFSNGYFAHNIIVTFLYEFGILGIVIFLGYLFFSYKYIGNEVLYFFIPFFIAGFSLFSAYMPFFFVLVSCLYIERHSLR